MDLVDFEGSDKFEYPPKMLSYDRFNAFPMLYDAKIDGNFRDDADDQFEHPIIAALAEQPLQAVEVGDDWIDDHQICFNVTATVNGKKYGFSQWWYEREGYKLYIRGESGKQTILKEIREDILAHKQARQE